MGIYQLAARHGVQDAHGTIIDLKITHQDLAEMVGTSRETVTRVIARLKESGIIEVDQRRMTLINPQKLLKE
jgi:CRP/FNR family cyclic AMP-dependent transcriptional regulator